MDEKKIKMYGFYSGYRKLIAAIPSRSIERAKELYNESYPDKKYLFIEVIK